MSAASWVRWSLAGVMVLIAAYHVGRLVIGHLRDHHPEADVDLTHAAMGAAMGLMLAGAVSLRSSNAWALAFSVPTSWFVLRTLLSYIRRGPRFIGQPLREAVLSGAMLVMLLTTATSSSWMQGMAMSGSGTGPYTGSVLLVVAAVVAVAVWTAAGLGRPGRGGGASGAVVAPRTTAACQLTMNATAVYMLLLMA